MRINYLAAMGSGVVSVALNATPTLFNQGNTGSGLAAVTPTITLGNLTDDIHLCFVQSSNEAIAVPTNSGSGTWAEVTNSPKGIGTAATAGSVRLGVFWMRDPGTSIGTVTVADTGNHTIAWIWTFRGCVTSGNPWNTTTGQTETGTTTAVTFPSTSSTIGNCLFVCVVANAVDITTEQMTSAATGNLTNTFFSGANVTSGTGGGVDIITGELAIAGSMGTVTGTMAGSSANYAEMVVALTSN